MWLKSFPQAAGNDYEGKDQTLCSFSSAYIHRAGEALKQHERVEQPRSFQAPAQLFQLLY
jgi:hypothetical protein